MNKLSWQLLEWWATRKAEQFNYDDNWVDLVMFAVAERAKEEHHLGRNNKSASC